MNNSSDIKNSNDGQFDLKLEGTVNRFQKHLKDGEFVVLFEIAPPGKDCDLPTVVSRHEPLLQAINEIKDFKAGLAITDKKNGPDTFSVVDFASKLCTKDRDRNVLFLSGRDTEKTALKETINACLTHGFMNIVPVSGNIYPEDTLKTVQQTRFLESVSVLNNFSRICEKNNLVNFGTTVNPFKYSENVIYPQYYKLINKIRNGASFIVAQAGWDMLKYQELRWYMENRGYYEPSLARIMLLNSDNIDRFLQGRTRDAFVPNNFLNTLKKEAKYSLVQFMAVQWRRLQFSIAGLRWLGYSGAIISGAENPSTLKTAAAKISAALKEFKSFDDWKAAYENYLARADMTPYPYRFYAFNNLFRQAHPDTSGLSLSKESTCTGMELAACRIKSFLFDNGLKNNGAARRIMAGCKADNIAWCNLQANFNICRRKCPKRMLNGPCQETSSGGICHFTDKECLYAKMFRFASLKKDFSGMEEYHGC